MADLGRHDAGDVLAAHDSDSNSVVRVRLVDLVRNSDKGDGCDLWTYEPEGEKSKRQPSLLGGAQPARATGRPEEVSQPSGDARERDPQEASEPGRQPADAPEPEQPAAKKKVTKKVSKKASRKKHDQKAQPKPEPEVKAGELIVNGEVHAIIPAAFHKAPPEARRAAHGLATVIHESAPVIQALIPSGMNMERFHAVTGAALMSRNAEKLAKCSRMSIMQALIRCAVDGLVPDGSEAYIVPMPNPMGGPDLATYIAKGQGVINRFAEEGVARKITPFEAFEIFEGDFFKYDSFRGLKAHVPWLLRPTKGDPDQGMGPKPKQKGEKLGWVARWHFPDGTSKDMLVEMADILKRRDMSPMYRSERTRAKCPWVVWEKEMEWKTVVRLSAKPIPKPTTLSRMLDRPDDALGIEDMPAEIVSGDSEQRALPAGNQDALDDFAGAGQ